MFMWRFAPRHRARSHTVGVHQQTLPVDFLGIALRLILVNELPPTVDANMILLAFAFPIFTNVIRLAFRALYGKRPQFIFALCNAEKTTESLLINASTSESDAIKLMNEYPLTRASAPILPTWL